MTCSPNALNQKNMLAFAGSQLQLTENFISPRYPWGHYLRQTKKSHFAIEAFDRKSVNSGGRFFGLLCCLASVGQTVVDCRQIWEEFTRPERCRVARWFVFNSNLGKFWRVLEWKMMVYFMPSWNILQLCIWYTLWSLGNFVVIWYIFPRFGIFSQEKYGNHGTVS
jgi:hypothetical protein